jgi:hypothetical protein
MTEDFSISRVLLLRKITREISNHLLGQLKEQLATLSPLFRPRRILGDYIESGSSEPVADAEKNFAVVADLYAKAAVKPLELPRPLRPPVKPIGMALEVYPWEYTVNYAVGGRTHAVTVTSPFRWVLSYSSGLSLSRLRLGLAGREERKVEDIQQFVIRCCVMRAILSRFGGVVKLLEGLRWEVRNESVPDLPSLPLATLSAPLRSQLPPENVVIESTELSGMALFEELVDMECLHQIPDPLAEKVNSILASHGAA